MAGRGRGSGGCRTAARMGNLAFTAVAIRAALEPGVRSGLILRTVAVHVPPHVRPSSVLSAGSSHLGHSAKRLHPEAGRNTSVLVRAQLECVQIFAVAEIAAAASSPLPTSRVRPNGTTEASSARGRHTGPRVATWAAIRAVPASCQHRATADAHSRPSCGHPAAHVLRPWPRGGTAANAHW